MDAPDPASDPCPVDARGRHHVEEQILRVHGYRFVRWLGKEIMTTPHLVVERISREREAAGGRF